MRLADFICVGGQKCGTTWLYKQISNHPEVYMQKKELDFFFKDLDLSWYAQHFEGAPAEKLCGDISPNYAAFPGLSRSIHNICPNARIIHILRNPVDRAFSQWRMARHLGDIPRDATFLESFHGNKQYMRRRGEYIDILKEFEEFYPLGKTAALFFYDDIARRPDWLMRQVTSFLGVDPDWRSPHLSEVVWGSPEPGRIRPDETEAVACYYAPFNDKLREFLSLERLPWEVA
jgi:hypothetical protein